MPIRVATGKIILNRDGQRITVRAGQSFDFTPTELADIRNINPSAVRKPRVEAPAEVQAHVESALEANAAELGELAAGVQTNNDGDSPAGGEAPAAGGKRGRGGRGGRQTAEQTPETSGEDEEL